LRAGRRSPILVAGCTGDWGRAEPWCAKGRTGGGLGRRQPQQRDDQPARFFSPPTISPPARSPAAVRQRPRGSSRPTAVPHTQDGEVALARARSNPISASSMRSACLNYATIRASPQRSAGQEPGGMNAAVRGGSRPPPQRTGIETSTPPECRAAGSWGGGDVRDRR